MWVFKRLEHFSCESESKVHALLNCLYVLQKPLRAKVSPQAFGANSGKEVHRMLLKPLKKMGYKSKFALASLIFDDWSLQ